MQEYQANSRPEKERAAVCGLYCEACAVYIGSTDDPKKLESLVDLFKVEVEDINDLICYGCKSEKVTSLCADCKFVECAEKREIDFCAECDEFPCKDLKDFQKAGAHRIELFDDGDEIREKGCAEWMKNARKKYSCSKCSAINSAYDLVCRKCGEAPASEYVKKHKDAIRNFLDQDH